MKDNNTNLPQSFNNFVIFETESDKKEARVQQGKILQEQWMQSTLQAA